jgi:hypothetical protein
LLCAAAAALAVLALVLALRPGSPSPVSPDYAVPSPLLRLLWDQSHGTPFPPGAGLDPGHDDYLTNHNADRMLRHLSCLGVSGEVLRSGPLTSRLLSRYDLVLVEMPVQGRPAFTDRELEALSAWVSRGGGLMVLAEHTNAFHNAERLNPLLERFGIRVDQVTAVDRDRVFAFEGWHKCRPAGHPVTEGLRAVAVASGASLSLDGGHPARPCALLETSAHSYADTWDPTSPGFSGNFRQDPGEPSGPLVMAAAATLGKGRLVVLGDRNQVGNVFLYYCDNAAFALQAWRWLSGGRLALPQPGHPYDGRERGFSIFLPETSVPSDVMTPHSFPQGFDNRTYYTLVATLNRDLGVIARCDDRLQGRYDMVLMPPKPHLFPDSFLERLGAVTLLVDAAEGLSPAARQILLRRTGAGTVQAVEKALARAAPARAPAEVLVEGRPARITGRFAFYRLSLPGTPLLELRDARGRTPVVVRLGSVDLFVQARMVRNDAFRTPGGNLLGTGPLAPDPDGRAVFRLLWAWTALLQGQKKTDQDRALPGQESPGDVDHTSGGQGMAQ